LKIQIGVGLGGNGFIPPTCQAGDNGVEEDGLEVEGDTVPGALCDITEGWEEEKRGGGEMNGWMSHRKVIPPAHVAVLVVLVLALTPHLP